MALADHFQARASLTELRPTHLDGRWVTLEPLAEEHAQEMLSVGADEDIWTYMARGPFRSIDDARSQVREMHERGVPFAIRTKDGRFAGCISYLNVEPASQSVEIGWVWVGVDFRGALVAAEAQYRLMQHAFENFDCGRVWMKTDARNPRSQATLERFGIVKEGVLRRNPYVKDGYIRDSAVYSLIGDEWPEFHARVEHFIGELAQAAERPSKTDWRRRAATDFQGGIDR